jgi:hypothetical protein
MLEHLFIYRWLSNWLEINHYSLPLAKKKEVLNMDNNKRPYYGWYIVIAATIIVLLSTGMRMGIGPFIEPVMDDLDFCHWNDCLWNWNANSRPSFANFKYAVYDVNGINDCLFIDRMDSQRQRVCFFSTFFWYFSISWAFLFKQCLIIPSDK